MSAATPVALGPAGAQVSDCSIGWIIDTHTGEAFRKLCGKWSCLGCGDRNVRRLAERFRRQALKYNRFITLTLAGDGSPTRKNLQRLSAGWRKLYYRLKRNYGLTNYAWVNEQGSKNRRLHRHFVVRCEYIPQRKLSRMAEFAGLGRVADIRAIRGELGMRSYLTKYLVKDAAGKMWPRYARRIQHNLTPEPPHREPETGRWIFQRKQAFVPWRRRPEAEFRLPEEVVLGPELTPELPLPFARAGPAGHPVSQNLRRGI